MALVRPEVTQLMHRWAEPALGAAVAAAGLWLCSLGGLIVIPIGLALAGLGLGWAVLGWRRARFQSAPGAPGLVELDEGRLRYLHPVMGGEVSLNELIELRMVTMNGRRIWQLRDLSGQALLVPVDTAGAGALFDAFASLPGLTSADLMAALHPAGAPGGGNLPATPVTQTRVWRRPGQGLTRG